MLIRLDSPSFQLAAAGAGIYRSFHPFGVDIVGCLQRDDAVFAVAFRKCSDSPVTLFLQAFCLNIGQVMFQGNTVLAGVLFLLGIMVNSRINGFYAALGAGLPIPFALLLGVDDTVLNAGLMGYNGVLCAIALGDKTWKGGAWATVAVLLSVLLQIGGMKWGITTLTAPFVVAVWIVAGCRAGWKNRNRN